MIVERVADWAVGIIADNTLRYPHAGEMYEVFIEGEVKAVLRENIYFLDTYHLDTREKSRIDGKKKENTEKD